MTNHESNKNHYEDDRPSLSLNERIVWISDNGPEYGYVRWLGKLPDLDKEWMAGVEFDNPVGSGTGLYKDKQLFITRLNHASLVPVIGLLKASDFDEPPKPPTRTSSTKLIDLHDDEDLELALRKSLHDAKEDLISNHRSHNDQLINDDIYYRSSQPYQVRNKVLQSQIQPKLNNENSNKVRHIPIRLVDSDETCRHVNPYQPPSANKRPILPMKPTKTAYSNHAWSLDATDNISSSHHQKRSANNTDITDELIASFSKTNLNDKREQYGIPLLPAPSLVVPSEEKNPSQALKDSLGKSRGIQGHNNSCYMDATLFAMFSSTTLFDSLLYRPANKNDIPGYREIQQILREDIARPLREENFVSADQVMVFRTMLEKLSSVDGLTDQEKDPEEFLDLLLRQILKAEPFLKLISESSSNQSNQEPFVSESFFHQLFVIKDENVALPTVQDLFEQSFVHSKVRLREIPPCLLLHMPRHGRQYKMYPRIMPTLKLDITDVLEAVPRSCGHRGKDCDNLACYECKGCFSERSGRTNSRLSSITYCHNCFQSKHFSKSHTTGIEDHDCTKTLLSKTPSEAILRYSNNRASFKDREIPRIYMDLFAILCIETSHYVCFVKCGPNSDSPWCFFDSMADRRGEQNGYNIPEVIVFGEFAFWTSERGSAYLLSHKDDKSLPEMARRLICDAYLCFYQYPGLITYR